MFAKNESRGLTSKNYRWWSLLILLLYDFSTHSYVFDIHNILYLFHIQYIQKAVFILAARCLCSRCFWSSAWNRLQRHLRLLANIIDNYSPLHLYAFTFSFFANTLCTLSPSSFFCSIKMGGGSISPNDFSLRVEWVMGG